MIDETPPTGTPAPPLGAPSEVRQILPEGKRTPITDFRIFVARFELRSNTDWLVGFELKSDLAGKKSTVDVIVPSASAKEKTDYEICALAYDMLKQRIKYEKALFETTPTVIGTEFVPPDEI